MTGIRTLSMASQQVLAAYVDNAKEGMYARVAGDMANGTSLRGYVDTSYANLVSLFGEPDEGDEYKVDAEWTLYFADGKGGGEVVTIYNYKDGKNYCGEEGTEVEDITDWHVGGRTGMAPVYVQRALDIITGTKLEA